MKRSTSAPLIPELLEMEEKSVHPHPPAQNLLSRRVTSGSIMSLPGEIVIRTTMEGSPRKQPLASPLSRSCINSPTSKQHRVEQLKKEENIDERKNEKEVQEQIMLSRSCDELRLDPEEPECRPEQMDVYQSQPSPSHQPLSPLASRYIRSRSLTPTSPGSSRSFSYRRSCSPVLRPSSLCFQVGRKRARDSDSQEDMDISPGIPSKRIQLGFPSPLNLSPSVSPLMGNSPLQHSFCTRSRKSSSTQSESTPLSSPSSLAQAVNPFAINYDSGNCEHWQSNSGSGSNCSSPSISHAGYKGSSAEALSFGSPFKIQVGGTNGGGASQEDAHQGTFGSSQVYPVTHHHSRVLSLSPSPSGGGAVMTGDDHLRGAEILGGMQGSDVGLQSSASFDVMTETPTPLSPKGLQFRQKLFPPQNLPSPIPRSLPHSIPSVSYSTPSSSSGPLRGGRIAAPMSPKSHVNHHQPHSSSAPSSSLHHDKHLSPFKADLAPGRIIRTVTKKRRNHFYQMMDSVRSPPSMAGGVAGGGGGAVGGASNEHIVSWLSSHHSQSSSRQTISSPLATLSMSSNLEDSGAGGGGGIPRPSAMKRKLNGSEGMAIPPEDELMENDGDGESPAITLMEEGLMSTCQDKSFASGINRTMSS